MKSGVLMKNILITLLGLCIMAVLGLVLMVVNSDQGWMGNQSAATLVHSNHVATDAQLGSPGDTDGLPTNLPANTSGNNPLFDDALMVSDAAAKPVTDTALPEVSIEQKKQVLIQFFDAADTDIARIKKEITNARSLGEAAQKIQEKEHRLQQMVELRQKMMAHNASLL